MLRWNVYKVIVTLDQVAAGLRANTPTIEYVVTRNQPGPRELQARRAVGEELPSKDKLVQGIMDALTAKGFIQEEELDGLVDRVLASTTQPETEKPELAVFRRCKGHNALYVPYIYPRAAFRDSAGVASNQTGITALALASVQYYPGVIHLTRGGELLTQADERRMLRGSVTAWKSPWPRSIEQEVEVAYEVTMEFHCFVLSLVKATKRNPVTRDTFIALLTARQNMLTPHRQMGMGGVLDFEVEELEQNWEGWPARYGDMKWEREAFGVGWEG